MILTRSRTTCLALLLLGFASVASAQGVPPPLGTAAQFAVLGNSAVTGSAGTGTVVNGDVGSSPTPTITNFPPSTVTAPFILHTTNDNVVSQAHADARTAYIDMFNRPGTLINDDLSTVGALNPGVYRLGAGLLPNNQVLTLNGDGVFIFNVDTSLTMNTGTSIQGTASPCNIFWRIGTSATLLGTLMRGTFVADASITIGAGTNLVGRALAGTGPTGAVTMAGAGGNVVGGCSSAAAVVTPPPGTTGSSCPNPNSVPPAITTMNPQGIPVNGSITSFFTVAGNVIPSALQVTATSSVLSVVPLSGIVVTQPTLAGETTVRLTPTTNATGLTIITVSVRDPNNQCTTATSFVLSVGVAAVPTMAQWSLIALASLLMFAGYHTLQRRSVAVRVRG